MALTLASAVIFQGNESQFHIFAYASRIGHTFLDRELYLPLSWTQDRERCIEAGIPEQVRFQTKCELARQMIERAITAQMPFSWIVADSLYSSDQDLREWIERQSL